MRAASFNRQIAELAAKVAPDGVCITMFEAGDLLRSGAKTSTQRQSAGAGERGRGRRTARRNTNASGQVKNARLAVQAKARRWRVEGQAVGRDRGSAGPHPARLMGATRLASRRRRGVRAVWLGSRSERAAANVRDTVGWPLRSANPSGAGS